MKEKRIKIELTEQECRVFVSLRKHDMFCDLEEGLNRMEDEKINGNFSFNFIRGKYKKPEIHIYPQKEKNGLTNPLGGTIMS